MPTYRFGKHPAKHDFRTLRFRNYVTPGLAAPPPSFNVLAKVYSKLNSSDPTILGNSDFIVGDRSGINRLSFLS